jgi:hypothetical protein
MTPKKYLLIGKFKDCPFKMPMVLCCIFEYYLLFK